LTRGREVRVAVAAFAIAALVGCAREPAKSADSAPSASVAADTALVIRPIGPEGVRDAVRANRPKVTVLNVWATWCIPCREEFPDLLKLGHQYAPQGVTLMLVSADFDDQLPAARAFLRDHGVRFATYLKTGDDMAFIDSLNSRWTGALPATFVYDRAGQLQEFWEGKASFDEMERHVRRVLESDHATPE
jgi:thiol-disulfide isomerase/thioredoxin